MSRIIFNLAAKCDAAGRSQNQDNYWVCPDLTKWNAPVDQAVGTDEDIELSEKGALLVVADGMGGMKAGEVASQFVIDGVKKKFSNIPDSILTNEEEIKSFITSAIVEADESIKKYAKEHRDAEGLGSTIVLLWLLNGRAFCGWCGDSRIYRFNPNNELVRLSHDHSYVQKLVDDGAIPEEEAFDHPDGNLVSKALGDNGNKAEPELRVYDIYARDVFMLCSDGLCGLIQDNEINEIISRDCTSSKETLNNLWKEGEKAGWSDNATIDVLCIVDGGKPAKGIPDGYPKVAKKPVKRKNTSKPQVVSSSERNNKSSKSPYIYILALVAICLLGYAIYNTLGGKDAEESTNHEFNVEVPEGSSNNTNANNASGTSFTNSNNQGGQNNNTRGGNNNPQSNQAHGQGGTNVNNSNIGNQGSQNEHQQTGNATNGNSIDQDVVDYLPQNGNNSGNNPQQQQAQQRPSDEYMSLLKTTERDYVNIKRNIWPTILSEGNIENSERSQIKNFIKNVKNLTAQDNPSYKCLDQAHKRELATWLNFAKSMESELPSIPLYRGPGSQNPSGNYPNNNNNTENNPNKHNI